MYYFCFFFRLGVVLCSVVSSLRNVPRPGYGLQSSTLPAAGRNGIVNGYVSTRQWLATIKRTIKREFGRSGRLGRFIVVFIVYVGFQQTSLTSDGFRRVSIEIVNNRCWFLVWEIVGFFFRFLLRNVRKFSNFRKLRKIYKFDIVFF